MYFSEGDIVSYDELIGSVKFVCNSYFTLCIKRFESEKPRDVCILIYRQDFNKIKLLKKFKNEV
jgi:hypothetical protein